MSIDLNADCEINEAANASGQVKLDAQSQCFVEVYSKATQAALKATTTKPAKVQASRTVKEVACQTDLELPDILLMEEMRQRCSTPLCSEPSMTYEDNTHDKTYEPTLNSSVASSGEPPAARKFIVYDECLLQVFQACKTCRLPAEPSLQDEKRRLTQTVVSCGGAARVAGDSRADSPGYSAKYGVYSMLETNLNRIIDIELVQCNEVSSSTHMELKGLKRALASLDESGVNVTEAVTDRHPQVRRSVLPNANEKVLGNSGLKCSQKTT
ncbi:hypothetical protein HPB49_007764 [Dermacentor silvarum]|uniref:Uncharacterized protein n=1 Tax=Dermacentor silvarum TaxID=543639 RepID=A0ACB8DXJ6_DERSI|nr:hypothetical protein HPB49_007764 [Dermacentor silvarum]